MEDFQFPPSSKTLAPYLALEMSPRGAQDARGGIARCKIDLKVLIEEGTLEERKRFIRNFGSSEGDGKDRKIRVGDYDRGGNSALRVMPPRGIDTKRSGECARETKILRLCLKTDKVVEVG